MHRPADEFCYACRRGSSRDPAMMQPTSLEIVYQPDCILDKETFFLRIRWTSTSDQQRPPPATVRLENRSLLSLEYKEETFTQTPDGYFASIKCKLTHIRHLNTQTISIKSRLEVSVHNMTTRTSPIHLVERKVRIEEKQWYINITELQNIQVLKFEIAYDVVGEQPQKEHEFSVKLKYKDIDMTDSFKELSQGMGWAMFKLKRDVASFGYNKRHRNDFVIEVSVSAEGILPATTRPFTVNIVKPKKLGRKERVAHTRKRPNNSSRERFRRTSGAKRLAQGTISATHSSSLNNYKSIQTVHGTQYEPAQQTDHLKMRYVRMPIDHPHCDGYSLYEQGIVPPYSREEGHAHSINAQVGALSGYFSSLSFHLGDRPDQDLTLEDFDMSSSSIDPIQFPC